MEDSQGGPITDQAILFVFDSLKDSQGLESMAKLPPHEVTTPAMLPEHNSELINPLICRVIVPSTPEKDSTLFRNLAEEFGILYFI